MEAIEGHIDTSALSDIQGFLIHDYDSMRCSRYVVLQVTDASAAKRFIKDTTTSITNAATVATTTCVNVAFTSPGLRALGLADGNINNFIREFREGMVTPHRQRLLGDFDSSAPENWKWGGPNNEEAHVLLMIFGTDEAAADNQYNTLKNKYTASGLKEVYCLNTHLMEGNKEYFGFRDGIAQPFIKGSGKSGQKDSDNLNAGEFVMGYKSEYKVYPDNPFLTNTQGDAGMLPDDIVHPGMKDLGKNGTYLVLRQLQQDVKGYWTFLNEHTKNEDGSLNEKASKKLAAKMMGRWPSGAPIIKFPDADPADDPNIDPGEYIHDNDFLYNENSDSSQNDKHGMRCPFGAHTRRTNPRDSFEENDKKESILLSNRHRIIRRGRTYGVPYIGSPTNVTPAGEVGLMFGCFNADISRQFEFIQYTWANYPKFKQLVNDPDPFIGVKEKPEAGLEQVFTIPGKPVNTYVTNMQRFVTVKGGGYFFFPSLTVIKYLATL